MLDRRQYRDNNNFLRFNRVHLHDGHLNIFYEPPNVFFADIIAGPVWVGKPKPMKRKVSYDNGKTEQLDEDELIFGTYFFLSDDLVVHYRVVYNIINLLAEFGGLNSVAFIVY